MTKNLAVRINRLAVGRSLVLLFALCPLVFFTASAQLVSDGATYTLNNVTTNIASTVTVGTNGSFTGLIVTNTTLLTNAGNGVIGRNTGANDNYVFLQGTNTRWLMGSNLFVGSNGAFNHLTISNDSMVTNTIGYIGYNSNSISNTVTVTGAGSMWSSASNMFVGFGGSFNTLSVSNGGSIFVTRRLTLGSSTNSTNNRLLAMGGTLASTGITLGNAASRGNAIALFSSSIWDARGSNFVWGNAGIGDTLTIDATSGITNVSGLTLDENSNAFFLTNAPGGFTLNGYTSNQFGFSPTATMGKLTVGNSGTNVQLTINNFIWSGTIGSVGSNFTSLSNSVSVTGPDALWTNSSNLFIGLAGSFNNLLITNGGRVANSVGFIGNSIDARNNQVTVTGSNSVWSNRSSLHVGFSGAFNKLLITNGGMVASLTGSVGYIGNNNAVTIAGASSTWTNSLNLLVGYKGSFNSLLIANGGQVNNTLGSIGYGDFGDFGSNNQVTVTGPNSLWNNSSDLDVGFTSSFNTLLINDGGRVANGTAFVGHQSTALSNQVIVTGPNSVWNNSGNLSVGYFGGSSTLLVANGGRVANIDGSIGCCSAGTSSNQVTVTGADSVWTNSGSLYVGEEGPFNTLVITDGGTVYAANSYVGYVSSIVSSYGNLLSVGNGTLTVTNSARTAVLDVRSGNLVFDGGMITTDRLLLNTSAAGAFTFNAGTLNVRTALVANARPFIIGNGTGPAILDAVGNGTHTFANGLLIQTNATLTGTGTINGSVTNCGTIFLTNADQMIFTGSVVNKGVILALTGTPRFGSTFTNLGTLITTASINVSDLAVSGADLVLQFNTVSNYVHEVQASTNVATGVWQSLTNGLLGTGSPMTFTDTGGATNGNRTYRVLLH